LSTVLLFNSKLQNQEIGNPGRPFTAIIDFEKMPLFPGKFSLYVTVNDAPSQKILARHFNCANFRVLGDPRGGNCSRIFGKWKMSNVLQPN